MFEYNELEMPKDCIFKISPSQIDKFFKYPSVWYKEEVLKEKEDFKNTAMSLGTVCHYIYEQVGLGLSDSIDTEYIENQIETLSGYEDVDTAEVIRQYRGLCNVVVNEYIINNMPTHTEYPTYAEVTGNVYVGGTIDNITNSIVVDYKTVATKPSVTNIPFNYKIQLLAYAYALSRSNHFIDRIRLVYGVKPTKTLPARCFVVTEEITYEDWNLIEDTLKLMAETIIKVKKQPELTHLLFKSMKLKV